MPWSHDPSNAYGFLNISGKYDSIKLLRFFRGTTKRKQTNGKNDKKWSKQNQIKNAFKIIIIIGCEFSSRDAPTNEGKKYTILSQNQMKHTKRAPKKHINFRLIDFSRVFCAPWCSFFSWFQTLLYRTKIWTSITAILFFGMWICPNNCFLIKAWLFNYLLSSLSYILLCFDPFPLDLCMRSFFFL